MTRCERNSAAYISLVRFPHFVSPCQQTRGFDRFAAPRLFVSSFGNTAVVRISAECSASVSAKENAVCLCFKSLPRSSEIRFSVRDRRQSGMR